MHTLSGCKRPLARIKQLQELMKGTKVRWLYNPRPINSNKLDEDWSFGLDYSDCTTDEIYEFQESWNRLEKPIVESVRKLTFFQKLKRAGKSIKRYVL